MQTALRPYATAGVALVGASVIAVSPVTVTPTAVQEVRDAAVQLSALENPIEVYGQVLQQVIDSAKLVGQDIVANPAPILQQLIKNQFSNIAGLPQAIQEQIAALPDLPGLTLKGLEDSLGSIGTLAGFGPAFLLNAIGALTGTGDGTALGQLQMAIDALRNNGDFGTAFEDLTLIPIAVLGGGNGLPNLLTLLPELGPALAQPLNDLAKILPIAGGPLTSAANVAAALPIALLGAGVGPLLGIATLPQNLGNTINGLIEAAQTGDPTVAINAIVDQSSQALGTLLNGVVGQGGLISGLQTFRETIAQALGAPSAFSSLAEVNALPSATAKSVTLATPVEKTPTDTSGSSSGEEASGSGAASSSDPTTGTKESSTDTTSSDNKGDVKGGNLFTPGGSSTKGGRHRATDGPSFGQELKDAASKTIKGLTGLGGGGKSDTSKAGASAGESGSGSSGSSSSGSGSK